MDLIIHSLKSVATAIIEPMHLVMLLVFGIIFYFKNVRIVSIQKMTLGGVKYPSRTYIISNCIRNISKCNWKCNIICTWSYI